jgi:hypothetical protein
MGYGPQKPGRTKRSEMVNVSISVGKIDVLRALEKMERMEVEML